MTIAIIDACRIGKTLSVAAVLPLVAGACTAQLNSNTLDMQESYKGLLKKQILYNLGQAMDDRNFFPSQFLIGAGTAETSNSITPSIGVPLPATTLTNAVAVGAATTTTSSSVRALGNATLGVAFSDAWRYSWGVTPRTDPDELRRLRALYVYAAGKTPDVCTDQRGATVTGVAACFKEQYIMQGGRQNVNQAFTDRPGCVLCGAAADQKGLEVNPRLLFGFVTKTPAPGFHAYGSYGGIQFYVRDEGGDEAMTDFVFFVLEAMSSAPFVAYTPKPAAGAAPAARSPIPPKTQFMQPNIFSLPL